MPHAPIVPCLWFDDQAEAAAHFYTATFADGRVLAVSHYPEAFDSPGGRPRGSVLTVEFEIAGCGGRSCLRGSPRGCPARTAQSLSAAA